VFDQEEVRIFVRIKDNCLTITSKKKKKKSNLVDEKMFSQQLKLTNPQIPQQPQSHNRVILAPFAKPQHGVLTHGGRAKP
jgi:hypothetical protein